MHAESSGGPGGSHQLFTDASLIVRVSTPCSNPTDGDKELTARRSAAAAEGLEALTSRRYVIFALA